MNTLAHLDDASKEAFVLVLFEWDGGSSAYTNAQETITYDSVTYSPSPAVQVDLPPNSGGLDTEPCKIMLPTTLSGFVDAVSIGDPYPRTQATITEYVRNFERSAFHAQVLYSGLVTRSRRYPGGKVGVVEIQAKEPKALMEKRPAGAVASDQCCWQFGKAGCEYSPTETSVTFSGVNGNVIQVSYPVALSTDNLTSGLLLLNGAALKIRSVTQTGSVPVYSYDVELTTQVPKSWEGLPFPTTAVLREGCDRSIGNCRAFSNEANFGGFGLAIPAYKPTVETR